MRHDYEPYEPEFEVELEDEELYPEDYANELNQAKNEQESYSVDADDWERLMLVAEVMDSVRLKGHGKGKHIVGTTAVLLEDNEDYGFEVRFWRLGEEEALPEGWNK